MIKPYFLLVLLCCAFVITTISVAQAQTSTPTPTPSNSPTPTPTPTSTPSPTPTPTTPTPTPTATPTPTPNATATPTPTPTPSPTPTPTNETYDAMAVPIWHISLPSFPLWTPVHLVVSYAYTQNYTVSVNTYGLSLHHETSSPTSIAFDTSAVDTYSIHVSVRYGIWVNQTVTISIAENATAAKLISFDMNSQGFDVDMLIVTSQAPSYPTADQIANNLWNRWQNVLNELQGSNQNLVNSLLGSYAMNAGFSFVAFGLSMALLIVVIYLARRQARFDHFVSGGNPQGG